jgi:hypothetical protein
MVDSGKCWCNRITIPLINDPEMAVRNSLTLLTRALFDNEKELEIQGHVVNHHPDLIVKDIYGFQPDPLWIYTRDINNSVLNKAKHKSRQQLLVASNHQAEVSKVNFSPDFIELFSELDLNLHLSFIIDGDEISVTDGLQMISGTVNNLELLINIFDSSNAQIA